MSATEVMMVMEQLPARDQEEVFALLTRKMIARRDPTMKSIMGKNLSFEEACDVVFRENRELLDLLG